MQESVPPVWVVQVTGMPAAREHLWQGRGRDVRQVLGRGLAQAGVPLPQDDECGCAQGPVLRGSVLAGAHWSHGHVAAYLACEKEADSKASSFLLKSIHAYR